MKRIISIVMAALLAASLAACGSSTQAETTEAQTEAQTEDGEQKEAAENTSAETEAKQEETAPTETEPAAEAPSAQTATESAAEAPAAEPESDTAAPAAHSDVLVAYFSATGTTKGVAEKIASITGGDLYEILAAQPYTEDDLNYNVDNSRSTTEQNDKNVRPEIGSEDISLEGYKTIYLGFPIWWGEEPRILDTFVEKYSFDGITVIPFCTSGGSGIGRSGPNMEALAGSGTWLEGERFSGSVSEADLQSWIDGLK
jgi:flavodoxin